MDLGKTATGCGESVGSHLHNIVSQHIKTKHLGCFNHILGCLSCISMTKECGFLESLLRSFFSSISWPHLSEDLFGYIPGITTITMQSRNYPGAAV